MKKRKKGREITPFPRGVAFEIENFKGNVLRTEKPLYAAEKVNASSLTSSVTVCPSRICPPTSSRASGVST